ncbi:fatty acid synthase subunit beta domain-containing protein [Corynebacterium caspium]|uniref:fatty acid synthase subunit beta domain-containing protein n=1 Tax=Corynebacterium caspium TaxID=234828 RepID=UPI00315DED67
MGSAGAAGEKKLEFIISYAGQGFNWMPGLRLAIASGLQNEIQEVVDKAAGLLQPLEEVLAPLRPKGFYPVQWARAQSTGLPEIATPALSVPGIFLTQLAITRSLEMQGLDTTKAIAVIGHSQGILANKWWQERSQAAEILAIAQLIGAAITRQARLSGLLETAQKSPMVLVSGITRKRLARTITEVSTAQGFSAETAPVIGLRNSREAYVLVGKPAEVAAICAKLQEQAISEQKEVENRQRGGSAFNPDISALPIPAGFHHPVMQAAVTQVAAWAKQAGLDLELATQLATAVLVTPVDWPATVQNAADTGAAWVLDLGPEEGLVSATESILAGRGIGVLGIARAQGQEQLFDMKAETDLVKRPQPWSDFSPRVEERNGQLHLVTRFTEVTGRTAVMLPGMTPTTVDPEIVAAAANAGHWAELAGGGQVTPQILEKNLAKLASLLEPGINAQFNAMFLNPEQWRMHIEGQRLIPKARANGAPIDGICISAGMPAVNETVELIKQLRKAGLPWISLKPGAVRHIQKCLEVADAIPEIPLILQVEGGHAGGHHSWEDLNELLLATYGEIRKRNNVILAVGGGIATPEQGASYLTGMWAENYNLPLMPVDAIMLGTVAMATLESTASAAVKEALVATPGFSSGWVGQGQVRGQMTSGLSQFGADIYEIDNAYARAGRLLDEVAGDAAAVAAREDEIIAAIAATAKPYFGHLTELTYQQWLERYLELSGPHNSKWDDTSWLKRFQAMLERTEARLNNVDHGEFPALINTEQAVENPAETIAELVEKYPLAAKTYLTDADAAWFIATVTAPGKPANFVPVIDADVRRRWRSDSLWQSHDERYSADQVGIIPGPIAVGGITVADEPIAELFEHFLNAAITQVIQETPAKAVKADMLQRILTATDTSWAGRNIPAITNNLGTWKRLSAQRAESTNGAILEITDETHAELIIPLIPTENQLVVRLTVPADAPESAAPQVNMEDAAAAMSELCRQAAGGELATIDANGRAKWATTLSAADIADYQNVTNIAANRENLALDVLVGKSWPAIFAVINEAYAHTGIPVVEGLLSLVHLSHQISLLNPEITPGPLEISAALSDIADTARGRILVINTEIYRAGKKLAQLEEQFVIRGRVGTEPEPELAPLLAEIKPAPTSYRNIEKLSAPESLLAFAVVSGDRNPIHTSAIAAALAGLPNGVIVHGMWTSAVAQGVASFDGLKIREWHTHMLAPVLPGAEIEFAVNKTGFSAGSGGGEVRTVIASINGETVLNATAVMATPKTFYGFPGQGIQSPGMGMLARNNSAAAREIWSRADQHTRAALGFSILEIVQNNPGEVVVAGETFHHPEGVLYLTQFTQVAMATLGVAQIAEMLEAEILEKDAYFAGHSVGEYNALAAYGKILSLEAVVEIVYRRGLTMDRLVERDATGNSNYGLAALRPNKMGLSAAEVFAHVKEISKKSGEFLEIVNYNIDGVQYAVAGTRAGLAALAADAEKRAPGKRAFIQIPGIDVPFHSSLLRTGVDAFRDHLNTLLPAEIAYKNLLHRYLPNLVARPFELSDEFLHAVLAVVDSAQIKEVLADPQRFGTNIAQTARTVLIELLAWQFASPVRWIETQELLLRSKKQGGLGIERFVEIGVGSAPTLANMLGQTLRLPQYKGHHIEVLNIERDRPAVFLSDNIPTPITELNDSGPDSPVPSSPSLSEPVSASEPEPESEPATAPAATAKPADLQFSAADATAMLLAYWTKVRPDQMGPADTIEALVEGVSSRRNQLLLDLGVELGLGAIEGAADTPLAQLQANISQLARGYKAFGPVLSETITEALRRLSGPTGAKPTVINTRIRNTWQLGPGWEAQVLANIVLGSRQGASLRGGDLATLPPANTAAELNALVDTAIQEVAKVRGINIALPSTATAKSTVDAAAVENLLGAITGPEGILAENARDLLARLGLENKANYQPNAMSDAMSATELAELITSELGSDWAHKIAPRFDPEKAVLLDDRWASAREDIMRAHAGLVDPISLDITGAGEEAAQLADFAGFTELANQARNQKELAYAQDVAVITGASPNSIAADVVAGLLAGGATVIATTSNLGKQRLEFYKQLYRNHARGKAALWVVPCNAASFTDIDALAQWIGTTQTTIIGAEKVVQKPALVPTLLFPFAAPAVHGTLNEAGPEAENQMRLLLWSVERSIAKLSALGINTHVDQRLHVVLPGSPNRGRFGGDGAYGEAKAALDAILQRWKAEKTWAKHSSLVQVLIGWVRGTGLMGANDPLVAAVEAKGIKTFSTAEMAQQLLAQISPEIRAQAAQNPITVDITGGLGELELNMADLAATATATASTTNSGAELHESTLKPAKILRALPVPRTPLPLQAASFVTSQITQPLEEMVVIVGAGELSPLGSSRTRYDIELGGKLSAAGVIELAWSMGLISWDNAAHNPGWVDAAGQDIAEEDIYEQFHEEVLARIGVRRYHDDFGMVDNLAPELTAIYLDKDLQFSVDNQAVAHTFYNSEPTHTVIYPNDPENPQTSEWTVIRKAGSKIRVPRRMAMTRFVGGQIPEGFDPAVYGIPADMIDAMDRVAVWNLVCTVDAFLSSGFTPAEILSAVHPARISSTQGTGMGGMESLRAIYVERLLDEPRATDVLQEALPNVIAAHIMQDYVGGYGQMVHPVAACATAAVSVEEGLDKIRLGKSDIVVTGGFDDLGVEGISGFGNMAATADSNALAAKGIEYQYFSRANDRRRAGFVESEGGGTIILARANIAAELGLPVLGVVAFAESFADGAHTSIPAPGLGALSAARGGPESRLAKSLAALGVTPNDIAVISKHDTSTNANDPNESDLHERISTALGRSTGNPLYVVSQKTLTGHAKGAAAAFQIIGLCQVLRTGIIPPNNALDCVDPELRQYPHLVWLRQPLNLGPTGLKAGLVTSLGFGHVSALVAIVHPGAFIKALENERGTAAARTWENQAKQREQAGIRRLNNAMYGGAPLYTRPAHRNLGNGSPAEIKEREAAVLLDPKARLIDGILSPARPATNHTENNTAHHTAQHTES